MILYHFPTSPFSRRARLALAHKALPVELRDARASEEHLHEVRRINPVHTVPVLVDGQKVVADSTAICHYLDRKVPHPPLWPEGLEGAEAFELVALADTTVTILADLGMRYAKLRDHPSFSAVRAEYVGRVQRALDALAACATAAGTGPRPFLCGERWTAADMAVYPTVVWLENMPARAAAFPPAKNVIELGWSLPPMLRAWADQHRQRPDVVALG